MRGVFFLSIALWAAAGSAQTMYKCVDGQRKVTYSNVPCEKQGLKYDAEVGRGAAQVRPVSPLIQKLVE